MVVKVMQACIYCWILVGLIWVLISRMPFLANLSPLYKHRSRNVISSVVYTYLIPNSWLDRHRVLVHKVVLGGVIPIWWESIDPKDTVTGESFHLGSHCIL